MLRACSQLDLLALQYASGWHRAALVPKSPHPRAHKERVAPIASTHEDKVAAAAIAIHITTAVNVTIAIAIAIAIAAAAAATAAVVIIDNAVSFSERSFASKAPALLPPPASLALVFGIALARTGAVIPAFFLRVHPLSPSPPPPAITVIVAITIAIAVAVAVAMAVCVE